MHGVVQACAVFQRFGEAVPGVRGARVLARRSCYRLAPPRSEGRSTLARSPAPPRGVRPRRSRTPVPTAPAARPPEGGCGSWTACSRVSTACARRRTSRGGASPPLVAEHHQDSAEQHRRPRVGRDASRVAGPDHEAGDHGEQRGHRQPDHGVRGRGSGVVRAARIDSGREPEPAVERPRQERHEHQPLEPPAPAVRAAVEAEVDRDAFRQASSLVRGEVLLRGGPAGVRAPSARKLIPRWR